MPNMFRWFFRDKVPPQRTTKCTINGKKVDLTEEEEKELSDSLDETFEEMDNTFKSMNKAFGKMDDTFKKISKVKGAR